ncbi:MAG: hypothetical protein JWM80_3383 [Cyanobacteria bacterium RYN_339]|nr:hypothetical protein [Cyanobacteria bacterium RYN_339]
MTEPTRPTVSWPAVIAASLLGFLAWGVPLAAYGLAFFFTVGKSDFGNRELLLVAGAAAVGVFALPLGALVWQRWYPAALGFAVGALVGVGPLLAFLAWFFYIAGGRR